LKHQNPARHPKPDAAPGQPAGAVGSGPALTQPPAPPHSRQGWRLSAYLPGLGLALALAALAYGLGRLLPVVGGPVFGILLGIALASVWRPPARFGRGLKFSGKWVLQAAVVLLGFEMNLASVLRVGQQSLWIILLTLAAAFLTAVLVGRALGVPGKLTALIGAGTAICGGSAIAAVSTAIEADERDISFSISTIFLFNVAAVFLFPLAGRLLGLSDTGFGMWAGTAINDTSSVVAAAYSYSPAAGQFATVVKLTRSLMILPVTLGMAIGYARLKARNTAAGRPAEESAAAGPPATSFIRIFPWFVLAFLLASLLRTSGLLSAAMAGALATSGRFLIIAAMAAIGLGTSLQAFRRTGPRALLLGAATWAAVLLASLAVQYGSQMW